MGIKVVFLGPLGDIAECADRMVPAPLDWDGLVEALGPGLTWHLHSTRVKLALNGVVVSDKEALVAHDGDEIALLPPVSGG